MIKIVTNTVYLMQNSNLIIKPYEDKYREQLIDLWEKSVRATHTFVSVEDIEFFKSIVVTIDFNTFEVYCSILDDTLVGFIGVADKAIEMLFLDPDFIGRGIGKKLMTFAINELKADRVDVNEQNINAVNFYQKFGFRTYERTEKDSEGKDYPILKMRIRRKIESGI